mmetsp:Transcript_58525/g.125865  ORF Transcript_58525/g.125865 Transcript_58525/m.125865 type:complete len:404 (-) Transcript_58525:43-1254(-)
MVHLIIQRLVDHWAVVQLDCSVLDVPSGLVRKRVLHPVHVITIREIFLSVSPARLLASLSTEHLLCSLRQQVLKLHSLDQVRVPDQSAIRHTHILELLQDLRHLSLAGLQILGIAVDRGVLLHGQLQFLAQSRGRDRATRIAELVEASNCLGTSILRNLHRRGVGLHQLGRGVRSLSSENNQIEQRVGSQTIGTVHGGTTGLTSSQQPLHNLVLASLVLDHLGLPVGRNTSHVVVHRRQHRDRLLCHIHPRKDLRRLTDSRQSLTQRLRRQVVQVQVHVVLVRAHTTALPDLHCHCSRHNVARCQILRGWRVRCHEWITVRVLQNPSFTSAPFRHQATSRENSRRVELNELQVLQRQPLPRHCTATVSGTGVSRSTRVVAATESSSRDDSTVCTEAVQSPVLH